MFKVYPFIKRILDILGSLIMLAILSPVFLLIMVSLLIVNRGKPFFTQERPGRDQKIFKICKFKTMTDATDEKGQLLPDGKRLTKLGILIRKSSLDELPQLFNVLKGDMSFIGPRPLMVRYLPYYTEKENIRHSVRPGISGLAQVSGRNVLKWDDRLQKDIEYVENLSLFLDLKILFLTVLKVLQTRDVVVDPTILMPALDVERQDKSINS